MITYDDLWKKDDVLEGHDARQREMMDETCILIDENDCVLGSASKKECHLMNNINAGMLHRAFSVFLFDSQNRLLLQQRASEKITFPDCYTNTCCSHPLFSLKEELEVDSQLGIKRAAQRKLQQELGIQSVPLEAFKFITRIHYKAPSNGVWGEHEIDYILFVQLDVNVNPNPNEVKDVKYVTMDELRTMMNTSTVQLTPWFKLIADVFLFTWWKNLDQVIQHPPQDATIHRL